MTGTAAVPGRRQARRLVAALAVTQTIGYGTLYYAFGVLLVPVAAALHASATAVTGAFTAGILTGALLAVPIGRWLDRHGGRAVMTAGSLAGVVLLVAFSRIDSMWQLYAVQIGIGAATAASLYEAAFAVVLAWHSPRRRSAALLAVTVVAGFSSTVFLPLTGWLVEAYGWRTALLVLAAVQAVTVPLHALTTHRPPRDGNHRTTAAAVRRPPVGREFWLLAAGFTAHTAATSTVTVHLVAALTAWGHPPRSAASIAGLLGVLSVAGRLLTTGLTRRYRTSTVTAAVFGVQAAAAVALPLAGAATAGAIGAVIGLGLGFGVATLAKPVLLAERYGTRHHATLAGLLVVPVTLAKATAPLATAGLGHTTVLLVVAGCCAAAATAIAASGRR